MSIACPKCGFDLEPGKPCRVCGYRSAGMPAPVRAAAAAQGAAAARAVGPAHKAATQARSPSPAAAGTVPQRPPVRRRSQGPVIMLIAAAIGLLAVVGVFILGDLRVNAGAAAAGTPAQAVATAPAATEAPAATPAADPAPAPAAAPPATAHAAAPAAHAALKKSASVLDAPDTPYDITKRTESPPTTDRASFVAWMRAHTDQKEKFLSQKWELTRAMLSMRSLTRPRVLEAILRAPREFFARDARRAYDDAVLPIGYGQTISGPHMVARMTDYLDPQPDQKVLEIGTGSGYQSSVLAELSNHVYTIEIVDPLARETDAIYRAHESRYPEFRNIHRKIDDGYYGWPQHAPFDRIIVTCGIDHVPPELLRELAPEGIMVIPVGPPSGQTILRIVKHVGADGVVNLDREDIFQGKRRQIFVPFTSKAGGIHVFEDKKEVK